MPPPFDPQRYLGLDDREFEELRSRLPGRSWWRVLLWLAYVKRRRILRGAIWLVFGLAATTTALTAFFAIVEPWNHSLYLWPTLTGGWYGEFSAPAGRQVVHLQMDGETENPSIEGTATTCDAHGTLRKFDISGSPRNWRGTRFGVTTSRRDEIDDEGVRLAKIDGEWDHDTMRVTAGLERFKQAGGASIGSTADPPLAEPVVHFTLQRGSQRDFAAACQRLRGSR